MAALPAAGADLPFPPSHPQNRCETPRGHLPEPVNLLCIFPSFPDRRHPCLLLTNLEYNALITPRPCLPVPTHTHFRFLAFLSVIISTFATQNQAFAGPVHGTRLYYTSLQGVSAGEALSESRKTPAAYALRRDWTERIYGHALRNAVSSAINLHCANATDVKGKGVKYITPPKCRAFFL
jgi:hypothetical protein